MRHHKRQKRHSNFNEQMMSRFQFNNDVCIPNYERPRCMSISLSKFTRFTNMCAAFNKLNTGGVTVISGSSFAVGAPNEIGREFKNDLVFVLYAKRDDEKKKTATRNELIWKWNLRQKYSEKEMDNLELFLFWEHSWHQINYNESCAWYSRAKCG